MQSFQSWREFLTTIGGSCDPIDFASTPLRSSVVYIRSIIVETTERYVRQLVGRVAQLLTSCAADPVVAVPTTIMEVAVLLTLLDVATADVKALAPAVTPSDSR